MVWADAAAPIIMSAVSARDIFFMILDFWDYLRPPPPPPLCDELPLECEPPLYPPELREDEEEELPWYDDEELLLRVVLLEDELLRELPL